MQQQRLLNIPISANDILIEALSEINKDEKQQ